MRILIGVDGSAASDVACELVANRGWPVGTRVRLVAAIEPVLDWTGMAPRSSDTIESQRAALRVTLDEQADRLRRVGMACEPIVEVGRATEVLMEHASEWLAELVVVGSRGLGVAASALFGSVSAHMVDHAPCPVLVVRSPSISRMLLATDGTQSSLSIPRILAAWRPAFHGVTVEVLSIAPRDEGDHGPGTTQSASGDDIDPGISLHRRISEQVSDEMMNLGWHAAGVTRAGEPSREIVAAADGCQADLIVVGSRGLGTVQRLLRGSVSHSVLLHSHASVLVMRGQVVARVRVPEARIVPAIG